MRRNLVTGSLFLAVLVATLAPFYGHEATTCGISLTLGVPALFVFKSAYMRFAIACSMALNIGLLVYFLNNG